MQGLNCTKQDIMKFRTLKQEMKKTATFLLLICGMISTTYSYAQNATIYSSTGINTGVGYNQCLDFGCMTLYTSVTGNSGLVGSSSRYQYVWYGQVQGLLNSSTGDSTYTLCNILQDNVFCIVSDSLGHMDTSAVSMITADFSPYTQNSAYYDTVNAGGNSQLTIQMGSTSYTNVYILDPSGNQYNDYFTNNYDQVGFNITSATAADSGIYDMTLTDISQVCPTVSVPIYVTVVSSACNISLTYSSVAAGCTYNSGRINLTASGGTAPYMYQNGANGTWQSSPQFDSLGAGTYTFFVRDIRGCIDSIIATVSRSPGYPGVAPTSNSPVPLGGTINLIANGTGSIGAYVWTGPNGFSSTAANPSISNVSTAAGGTYRCMAYTSGTVGCNANGLVTVAVGSAGCNISLSDSVTDVSTCLPNSGTVSLYALGGTLPFEYKNGANGTWQPGNVFSGLSAGVDSFYVRDTTGCTGLILATIGLSSRATPSVSVAASLTSLCGSSKDTFSAISANGGLPSYQWFKNGLAVGSNSAVYIDSSLANGDSVWVVMTSSLSCASPPIATSAVIHVTVSPQPPAPTLRLLGGCLGQDSIVISGYSGSIQYDWSLNNNIVHSSYPAQPYTVAGGNGAGTAASQLNFPSSICFDAAGYLYVADFDNGRVQKFPPASTSLTNGVTVAGGNGLGSAANQLYHPVSVFIDGSGNLYVCDQNNNRIQKFPAGSTSATNGVTVAGGHIGSAANQLNFPAGVWVDGAGNIYVCDRLNSRIQKFPAGSTAGTNAMTVAGGNGSGSAANQLYLPANITLSSSGDLYIADQGNNRVQKFPAGSTSATNGVTVAGGNGRGSAANQLNYPSRVRFDQAGDMYVGDLYNQRVQRFAAGSTSASSGVTVAGGYGQGTAADQMNGAADILFVEANGGIYVADQRNNRVQRWSIGIDSFYTPVSAGTYSATYSSAAGCTSAVSNLIVVNSCVPDTVWPGDADNNRLVDNNDLLTIGLGYDSTGPARTTRGVVWQADPATDWNHYFTIYSPTVNFVHADCNGDDIINANDTLAIINNFGDVHAKTNGYNGVWRSGIPSLRIVLHSDTVYTGDTMTAKFFLGDSATPVSNIYGLAFTYNYDLIPVDSNTVSFGFDHDSWFGTDTTSISLHKTFLSSGTIKAAITGIDHLNRSGSGQIATFRCIITTDNINGKDYSYYSNLAYISDITAIDQYGYPVPLNTTIDSNHVGYYPNGIREPAPVHVDLYPNPASTQVRISTDININAVMIADVLGQEVLSQKENGKKSETIDISGLAAGLYTIHVSTVNGSGTAKLIVNR